MHGHISRERPRQPVSLMAQLFPLRIKPAHLPVPIQAAICVNDSMLGLRSPIVAGYTRRYTHHTQSISCKQINVQSFHLSLYSCTCRRYCCCLLHSSFQEDTIFICLCVIHCFLIQRHLDKASILQNFVKFSPVVFRGEDENVNCLRTTDNGRRTIP